MMLEEYITLDRIPSVDEYTSLCRAVGWEEYMNFDVAEKSLEQSLFGVVIQFGDEIVGMGRVVGDGQIYFYIQDIAVAPDHQGKGVGQLIMTAITNYIKENAPEKAFVGLFASQGKESFYRKFGLNNHDGMTGMFGVVLDRGLM
ncbi:Acetyltransferase (GNAT) family protein [compost metagenome]